ncbi:MAG: hypothetical protein MJ207_02235 [Bacilli bacterium]|nr:hypothetical protein [Bacilli bacterium]
MNKKKVSESIHVINPDVLQIISSIFPKSTKKDLINKLFFEFKEKLSSYDINYSELRAPLEPSTNVFAFIFNSDSLPRSNYIEPIINTAINVLDDKSKCAFLTGDLIIDQNKIWIYKKIFEDSGVDFNIIFKHNICVLAICNISDKTAEKIVEAFKNNGALLFSKNITFPTIEKFALTYFLVQNFVKDGKKLLYSVAEDGDKCNYTFVKVANGNFKLCPINDLYYITFLTARPQQIVALKDDLKYAICFYFDIKNIKMPKINVSDSKLKYVSENKKIVFQKDELKQLIANAINSNQISHMSARKEDPFIIIFNVSIFYRNSKYKVALKWDFASNIVSVVTIVYA